MRDFDSIKQKEMGSIENRVRHIYNRGYEDGYKDGRENIIDTYDAGLNEAWDCFRKFHWMSVNEVCEAFGEWIDLSDFVKLTPSEAITKVKAWEEKKKQDDEIKVGDEVYFADKNHPRVVTSICTENGCNPKAVQITESGRYCVDDVTELKKTGRHFPEIAELLAKMQEE